jgi:hypothetical protein
MADRNTQVMSWEAGADLVYGDIVYLNTDKELVKCTAVEVTNAVGIVFAPAAEGTPCTVIVEGTVDACHLLVEDTDGESGYDSAIAYGSQLVISGKTSGTYGVGQALSAVGGTGQASSVEGMVVGKSLAIVAGADDADTYETGEVYVNFMA